MTWAEFQIRVIGYWRMQERDMLKVREIAYNAFISNNITLKKIPSIQQFMPIGKKKSAISDKMREAIKNAQNQYLIDKKKADNGIR